MNNLFQYTKTEGQGWLVEDAPVFDRRRFKYDYPDPGKEMELGKDFEVQPNLQSNSTEKFIAIPITQRTYSEQDLLDTWEAATNRFFDDQYGKVPTCSPSKSEFFKKRFGIEIK